MSGGLRVKGIKRGAAISIKVNGREVVAYEGETLHAALTAAGILILKKSRVSHQPRGAFCGMGICHECLVTVDGQAGVRSCMTLVREGMEVETHEP